jgi:hypothetical protein
VSRMMGRTQDAGVCRRKDQKRMFVRKRKQYEPGENCVMVIFQFITFYKVSTINKGAQYVGIT